MSLKKSRFVTDVLILFEEKSLYDVKISNITASGSGFHQLLAASKKRRKTPNLPKVLEPPAYQVINRCLSPLP
jgi:hypothetical protein